MTDNLKELLATTAKLMETVTEVIKQEQVAARPAPELSQDMLSGKVTVTPKELAAAMGLSTAKAHEIIHIEGFPVIKVGSRYVIPVQEFRDWLQKNAGKVVL